MWPSAATNCELLEGAKVKFDEREAVLTQPPIRPKRDADTAFGNLRLQNPSAQQRPDPKGKARADLPREESGSHRKEVGSRMMAHMLGLEIPGAERRPVDRLPADYEGLSVWAGGAMPNQSLPVAQSMTLRPAHPHSAYDPATQGVLGQSPSSSTHTWNEGGARSHTVFDSFDFQSYTNPADANNEEGGS